MVQSAGEYTDCVSAVGYDSPNESPGYDIKQSDGEVPVILELWGMRSTLLLPSLPGLPCLGVGASDIVLSIGKIELNFLLMLNWIVWNRTVYGYENRFDNKQPTFVDIP